MPLYEYRCSNCQMHFEVYKSMSQSDRPERCPCGAPGVRQYVDVNIDTDRTWKQQFGNMSRNEFDALNKPNSESVLQPVTSMEKDAIERDGRANAKKARERQRQQMVDAGLKAAQQYYRSGGT